MSIFSIFRRGLEKTAVKVERAFSGLFMGTTAWDAKTFSDLEAMLIGADFGYAAASRITADIRDSARSLAPCGPERTAL